MLKYIGKRILNTIPVLIVISMLIFGTIKAMPGDEVDAYLGTNTKITQEKRNEIKEELGLNKSLPEQYINWAGRFIRGDLGRSVTLKRPVSDVMGDYIWNTFILNVISFILAMLLAIPIGIKQAVKRYSAFDNFWTVFSLIGISVPTFFFAMILIYAAANANCGIPLNGMQNPINALFGYKNISSEIFDVAKHMIIPTIVLTFGSFASMSRYVRNAMIDVINQDYIRTARAKGLSEKVVIYKHAFKNALIPLVTLFGMYIPSLFSGAVILESLFLWPGIGKVLIDAINARDTSLAAACLMFSAILMILGNLLSDVLYSVVDPRIKVE